MQMWDEARIRLPANDWIWAFWRCRYRGHLRDTQERDRSDVHMQRKARSPYSPRMLVCAPGTQLWRIGRAVERRDHTTVS